MSDLQRFKDAQKNYSGRRDRKTMEILEGKP